MLNKLLMVTICLSPFYIHAKDNSKNSVTIKNATEVIKNRMKDPESTQFRNLRIVTNTVGEKFVCGESNSKNSYGGYVGFKPFAYTKEDKVIFSYEDVLGVDKTYDLTGCNGKKAEESVRKSLAEEEELVRKSLAKKEYLANNPQFFNDLCTIDFNFYLDVLNGTPKEIAIEIAIADHKNNNIEVIDSDLDKVKNNRLRALETILNNKKVANLYKNKPEKYKKEYVGICVKEYKEDLRIDRFKKL